MAEILVIKLGALGDLVQADGALRDIREHHMSDHLTVMTTPPYRRYMERCPWVDEVFIDPRASRFNLFQMLGLKNRLKKRPFDQVYDLQQVGRTRFYYRWLFPQVSWLGDAQGCSFYLKRPVSVCAADHFARHLDMAGLAIHHTLQSDVSWMAADVSDILSKADLISSKYIVLIPGASGVHESKRWPYFKDLATHLIGVGKRVVTVPGPDEMALCHTIPGDMLVKENGHHDIFSLAGIVKHADYVIGNDTGPTHIAAHLGCKGLALYGKHTPAHETGIQHSKFDWLEVENLAALSLENVLMQINPYLS